MRPFLVSLVAALMGVSFWCLAQRTPMNLPLPAGNPTPTISFPGEVGTARGNARVDPLQIQKEAKELLQLSQELQPEIESVNRGVLPKETLDKLKRIEKLSKRLRNQLTL